MTTKWGGGFFERSLLDSAKVKLDAISPAQWCQVFYALTTAGVLVTAAVPREARSLLADYGARKAPGQQKGQKKTKSEEKDQDWLVKLVAAVTSWGQVPHSWFSAFYGLSVGCSIFWLVQFLGNGSILRAIASWQADAPEPSATKAQVAAVWGMMLLQGARRVYEHAVIMKPSKSTMWFVHWFLGLGFYLVLSVATWVEGSSG
jgi:3-oxo-5-alpha-steroid 4-dehydrogenase 3 / polyprenol reductase